jgi:hypothetical protein
MESHSCAKTGEGDTPSSIQCAHTDAKGARCRMFATACDESGLCPHHARLDVIKRRRDLAVSRALLRDLDTLETPDSLTIFLSNLLREFVNKRIDRRDAATMAYISQQLLNSQAAFRQYAQADLNAQNPDTLLQFLKSQATSAASAVAEKPDKN